MASRATGSNSVEMHFGSSIGSDSCLMVRIALANRQAAAVQSPAATADAAFGSPDWGYPPQPSRSTPARGSVIDRPAGGGSGALRGRDPHRPSRLGAAGNEPARLAAMLAELPSSQTQKGRCCAVHQREGRGPEQPRGAGLGRRLLRSGRRHNGQGGTALGFAASRGRHSRRPRCAPFGPHPRSVGAPLPSPRGGGRARGPRHAWTRPLPLDAAASPCRNRAAPMPR